MYRILDAGRVWSLGPTLRAGGAVVFPHANMSICGHQIAAAVHACLDSGAERVLAIGCLHAATTDLDDARKRVAAGGDPAVEEAWGIQGPGMEGRQEWRSEFSLGHFSALWELETRKRETVGPELVIRYPYLAGGHPERLPGIDGLVEIVQNAVVVATMDPFHHGIGYGDPPERALSPEAGGLDLARQRIEEGLELLRAGDHWGYNQHCVEAKSDARDVGQVLRYLLGPLQGQILDLVACDTTASYRQPPPTWVANALIELVPNGRQNGSRAPSR